MELSDHLSQALREERRDNALRLNRLRLAGVGAFILSVVALQLFSEESDWEKMLVGIGIYFLIAVALAWGGLRSELFLRFSQFAIPVFDMPMVFLIQWINMQEAMAVGQDPRPFSEFSIGLFVCLLMLSAFTLRARNIIVSLGIAILLVQLLQGAAGVTLDGRIFSTIVLSLAAWICAYAGKNRVRLVESVARANTRRLRLQRYFSPGVGEMLEQWDEDELANGRECELSILFVDIRGFTTLSEAMPSREVVELLNAYHSRMVEAIFRNGGTLDKYLGDGLVAYFNAPVDQEDHALRAMNCAFDMEAELEELNQSRAKEGKSTLKMGVGLHTGRAIVGDIGAPHRREFTAIGSAVNIASRIEGLTKEFGRPIVVTGATRALIEGGEWENLGEKLVRGSSRAIQLFAPLKTGEESSPAAAKHG